MAVSCGAKRFSWTRLVNCDTQLFAPRPGLEDKPENRFTMIYSLAEDSGGTCVTIIQDDPRPVPAAAGDEDGDGEDASILASLKSVAESLAA
ncbi:hypothetical protein [Streptomyces sp. NPDC127197]|uniref:hypothetical protein n=1 Tax=Streptomyces sp. NPDC127197 TaxID=3345388 RepID=UPI00362BB970